MTQTNAEDGAGTGGAAAAEPPLNNEMMLHRSLSGSGSTSFSKEDEMTRTALSAFRAKESEIERRKTEVRERVQAQLGRVEEETRRLATIREVSYYYILSLNRKLTLYI